MIDKTEIQSRTFNEQIESARLDYQRAMRSKYPTLDQTVIDLIFLNYKLSLIKLYEFFIPGFDPDKPRNDLDSPFDFLDLGIKLPVLLGEAADEALSQVYKVSKE